MDRVVLTKYWLPAAAAATAVLIGLAAPAHALSDQQHKFVTDVVNHGGPSMDQMITPAVMETGKTEVIAGVNLPMLIKLASVRGEKPLNQAITDAQEAGRKYINVASQVLNGK